MKPIFDFYFEKLRMKHLATQNDPSKNDFWICVLPYSFFMVKNKQKTEIILKTVVLTYFILMTILKIIFVAWYTIQNTIFLVG